MTWNTSFNSSNYNWQSLVVSETGQFVIAATNGGFIFTSSSYGKKWNQSNSTMRGDWNSLSISNNGMYAIISDNSGNIYLSNKYGNGAWDLVHYEYDNVANIVVSDSGKYIYFYSNGNIYVSSNFGNSYKSLLTPSNVSLTNLQSLLIDNEGQSICILLADGQLVISPDYGKSWYLPDFIKSHVSKVSVKDKFILWSTFVDGSLGLYLASSSETETTTVEVIKYSSLKLNESIIALTISRDISTVFAFTNYGRLIFSYSFLFYTSQYYEVKCLVGDLCDTIIYNNAYITVSNKGQYVFLAISGSYVYKSANNGRNWTISNNITRQWRDIHTSGSGQYVYAIASNDYIYESSDYGQSWLTSNSIDDWQAMALNNNGQFGYALTGKYIFEINNLNLQPDPTNTPTETPSFFPSSEPTSFEPTIAPTFEPQSEPTNEPTQSPVTVNTPLFCYRNKDCSSKFCNTNLGICQGLRANNVNCQSVIIVILLLIIITIGIIIGIIIFTIVM